MLVGRRVQAFEIHDLERCPEFVRESVVESLGNALRWGRIYDPIAPVFERFCRDSGTTQILDLCSGSGEPVGILLDALDRRGVPTPSFVLSDKFPNATRMGELTRRYAGRIEAIGTSVDATAVPQDIEHQARTIISAFHHFPPALAAGILADCVAQDKAVFVLEPFVRDVRRTALVSTMFTAATALNPVITRRSRILKFALTYWVPVLPICAAWDAGISLLRMYSKTEFQDLVDAIEHDYDWQFEVIDIPLGGRISAFSGIPRKTGSHLAAS